MTIPCSGFRPFTWVMTTIKKIKGSTLLINAKLEKTENTPKQPYAKVFEIKNPPRVKERTIFLSLEHSTEERMAFHSNRPHPKLDESKLKYFKSEKCIHTAGDEDVEDDEYYIKRDSKKYTMLSISPFSSFTNEYKPGEWVFEHNFRGPSDPCHASDFAVFQETRIAKKNGFNGIVPSLITRKEITNPITLEKTKNKSGEDLMRAFLEETPNGKSTQRILNNFGLKAIKVERVNRGEFEANFHIHVRPMPKLESKCSAVLDNTNSAGLANTNPLQDNNPSLAPTPMPRKPKSMAGKNARATA